MQTFTIIESHRMSAWEEYRVRILEFHVALRAFGFKCKALIPSTTDDWFGESNGWKCYIWFQPDDLLCTLFALKEGEENKTIYFATPENFLQTIKTI